ncbi:transcriptional regulator NrdR [Cerasicoccus arenae]|uniref:Transcriptional repressor NrdR n=1 Tax=Cerasicoccus arenae TaxID=424488 RepID=A0A8J3D909_9BACT|nr:transcriptional regulator NrdR [Cerasicoccus arenae]MBK1856937.1 transcriptional repressor NrdR [Cerasicoccus arenae]GHB89933.1 transcriptional repressor NrdR [Cerasicoccus arenae]
MQCPKCSHNDTKVLDTRLGKNNLSIRRRRQCLGCGHRFTTIEEILREGLVVIKRNGDREEFDRAKMLAGIRRAAEKRPIEGEQIEMMLVEIMDELERQHDSEIPSQAIGEQIMKRLKDIDQIAYVRFASVYKDFRDISELVQEISDLNVGVR